MTPGRKQISAQPFSKKIPPAADENKHRDPQPDNMQNTSPKKDVSIKSLLLGLKELRGRGAERVLEPEGTHH